MTGFLGEIRRTGNGLLIRVCVIAAIGGLLFGYDTGVISGALLFIKDDLNASDFEQEAIVAAVLLGAMFGAGASGYLADRISRRWTKVISGSVYLVGALGCAVSINAEMLIGFRFLLGLAVGTASFVSPLYIAEMAPPSIRGGLVSFNQLAITSGILIAYITNFLFQDVAGDWRWMLGIAAVPGAILAVGMLSVPQTPRWLVSAGRTEKARDVLRRLRSGDRDADVDGEIDDIVAAEREEQRASWRDLLTPKLRPVLLVGMVLALAQQFVGVNTVIYYAPTILSDTGLSDSGALARTVLVGVTNVVFTVVAVLLLDRVGRRKLLIGGTVGMVAGLLTLAVYFSSAVLQQDAGYLALAGLLVFIASFAIGLGPVFWLMISEIFPMGVRSVAMAACTITNWGANFVVAQTFLSLGNLITRQGVFYLYTVLALLSLVFFIRRVPETRGRSLEEVQAELTRGS
ncbi:sugar porter family MFS transporter [uncultured Mycolicibacterium sp.]|uniref:sugar porter family MFS transporter n=1 Tax=uncultured Mycolicibacterium sp. TaxID=2320817 RepID=UPI0032B27E7E